MVPDAVLARANRLTGRPAAKWELAAWQRVALVHLPDDFHGLATRIESAKEAHGYVERAR
jgi:hypothetical protein